MMSRKQGVVWKHVLVCLALLVLVCGCDKAGDEPGKAPRVKHENATEAGELQVKEGPCRVFKEGQNKAGLLLSFRYKDGNKGTLTEAHLYASRSFTIKTQAVGEAKPLTYKGHLGMEEFTSLVTAISAVVKSCGSRNYLRRDRRGIDGFFRWIAKGRQAVLTFRGIQPDDLSFMDSMIIEKVHAQLDERITQLRAGKEK